MGAVKDVALVGLSATVANVKEIADWISLVHRPIVPIYHPHRPVPLRWAIADLAGEMHDLDDVRRGRARVVGDEPRGPDDRGRWYTRRVADPTVLIEALAARRWLPAIYFIFSRAGCERAMHDVLTEGRSLLTAEQQAEVERAIGEAVAESASVGESALSQSVCQGLRIGVALHPAGILPGLKRLIETLFERGLCRVVFATETMSLGIHMPARAVVLQGVTKRTDRGFRSLTHNERTQMAGGAGRRGIDPEGQCVIALDARDGLEDLLRVVDGAPEPIESQFKLGYGSVALLLGTGAPPELLRKRIESSFGQYQNLKRIREMEAEVRALEDALERARVYEAPCGDFGRIGRYRRARPEVGGRPRGRGQRGPPGEGVPAGAAPRGLARGRRAGAPRPAPDSGVDAACARRTAPRRPRCVPQRLLAGVPARGRGARAVRRRARRPAPAQGPAHREPPSRQRAAPGRDGDARALRRPHDRRGRRAVLGAARGVTLGRADDRARVPQEASQAQAPPRPAPRPRRHRLPGPARASPRCARRRAARLHALGLPLGLR